MEQKLHELNQLIQVAGVIYGIHKRVAKKLDMHPLTIQLIRKGESHKDETPENIFLINSIINAYKLEAEMFKVKLNKTLELLGV